MPHLAQKPHRRRRQRIIPRELQLGWKHAALEGRAFGPEDQRFPDEDVVFGDGAGGDAVGRVGQQVFVFVEEAARGDGCGGHGGRVVGWRLELLLLDGGDGVGFGRSLGGWSGRLVVDLAAAEGTGCSEFIFATGRRRVANDEAL